MFEELKENISEERKESMTMMCQNPPCARGILGVLPATCSFHCPGNMFFAVQTSELQNSQNFLVPSKGQWGASLVAQWLGVCLPMRGRGFEPWSGRIPHAAERLRP